MTNKQLEYKQFLEEQLETFKERDAILEKIEIKLYEMKGIAEYARTHDLAPFELERLNEQLNELKEEVSILQEQLHVVEH